MKILMRILYFSVKSFKRHPLTLPSDHNHIPRGFLHTAAWSETPKACRGFLPSADMFRNGNYYSTAPGLLAKNFWGIQAFWRMGLSCNYPLHMV